MLPGARILDHPSSEGISEHYPFKTACNNIWRWHIYMTVGDVTQTDVQIAIIKHYIVP